MAAADGVLEEQEQDLIRDIAQRLELSPQAKSEVEQMLQSPPSPVEVASWAIAASDRQALYRSAVEMAAADGEIADSEAALLQCLRQVLQLSADEIAAAEDGLR